MEKIIVITGLMASGKSTVCERLAQALPKSVHLRGDIFRRMIVSGREDMSTEPSAQALAQLRLRYRITAQVAKSYAAVGFLVIVQDNYYGKQLPEFIELLAPYTPEIIVLHPQMEVIVQREQKREKTGYTDFTIASLYESFSKETPKIGYWLDNSKQAPTQTVDEILNLLGL